MLARPAASRTTRGTRSGDRRWRTVLPVLLAALVSVQCSSLAGNGDVVPPAEASSVVRASAAPDPGATARTAATSAADSPRVSLRLGERRVTTRQRARAKVVLRPRRTFSSAQTASLRSARVKVRVTGAGGRRVVRARLADRRRTVTLPRLRAGVYEVRAVFAGNKLLGRSVSRTRRLTVVRPAGTTTSPAGWPDASNTGVPPGTTLTPYAGSCTITSAVTIDARTITCPGGLAVQAAGVVITNSMVVGRIVVDTDVDRSWSLVLRDSEVDAGDGDHPAITNGNVVIERADLHGGHNGLECQEHSSYCVLRDSWIHDQWQAPSGDTHLGGFLALGVQVPCTGTDGACVELVHNSIVCDAPVNVDGGGCTGDINLIPHYGPLPGALIQDNFLGANTGSAACTFGGAGVEYPATGIVYRDNVFERGTNGKCAAYGPVAFFDPGASGNVWSGNRFEDGVEIRCDATHDCM